MKASPATRRIVDRLLIQRANVTKAADGLAAVSERRHLTLEEERRLEDLIDEAEVLDARLAKWRDALPSGPSPIDRLRGAGIENIHVRSEPLTYYGPEGPQMFRDLYQAKRGEEKALERLKRHIIETDVELAPRRAAAETRARTFIDSFGGSQVFDGSGPGPRPNSAPTRTPWTAPGAT